MQGTPKLPNLPLILAGSLMEDILLAIHGKHAVLEGALPVKVSVNGHMYWGKGSHHLFFTR